MPSIMTLEGPRLAALPEPMDKRLVLFVVGGAALLGVAWLFVRHDRRGQRGLRGPEMLKIIASESRTAEEFARRADAWNSAERDPLPTTKLAKAYRKAKPSTMTRLLREAREAREESRERLWTRMSKGLRGRDRRGLDGYRVAYGTSDGAKTFRAFDSRTVATVEQATKLMRSYKRQGLWAWVEDEQGNFVPVPGAKSERVRKGYPLR